MKIIDISWPLNSNTTEYKDKKYLKIETLSAFAEKQVRETIITIHSHTGTHIDAPAHFIENGKTIDKLELTKFVGDCQVLDFSQLEDKITDKDLEKKNIKNEQIILLKTKNSTLGAYGKFFSKFVYLDKTGAQYLASKKIKTVGIDYLGIERDNPNHDVHKILLENEIPIVEGLRLMNAQEKNYFIFCAPIAFENLDGCFARAILIEK
jgi:arylformamidase